MNSEWANALAQIRGKDTSTKNNYTQNCNQTTNHFSATHNLALDTSIDIDDNLDEELLDQDIENNLDNDININNNNKNSNNDFHPNNNNNNQNPNNTTNIKNSNVLMATDDQQGINNVFNNVSNNLNRANITTNELKQNQQHQIRKPNFYRPSSSSSSPPSTKHNKPTPLRNDSAIYPSSTIEPPPSKRQRLVGSSQHLSKHPLLSSSTSNVPQNSPSPSPSPLMSSSSHNHPNDTDSHSDYANHQNSSISHIQQPSYPKPSLSSKPSTPLSKPPIAPNPQNPVYKKDHNSPRKRIPGPAGEIDDDDVEAMENDVIIDGGGVKHQRGRGQVNSDVGGPMNEDGSIENDGGDLLLPRPDPTDFEKMGWRLMEEKLESEEWIEAVGPGALSRYHIEYVKQVGYRRKVPILGVIVRRVDYVQREAFIIVSDRKGSIGATVHRSVIEEYPSILTPGTVLLLRRVSVYVPSPASFYLNITVPNVDTVFSVSKSRRVSSHSSEGESHPCPPAPLLPEATAGFPNSPEL